MAWPPNASDPLPSADKAWFEEVKVEKWILAEQGHAREWSHVFHVDYTDWGRVWSAIVSAVLSATIRTVRDRSPEGIVCGVIVDLAIDDRTAPVTLSWHYAHENAAPRLVTAYPTL